MKKRFAFFLTVFLIFSLTACGEPEPRTAVFTKEESGIQSRYVLEADDDIVHTITQTVTKDCSGYVEKQLAIIRETVEQYKTTYEAMEGVTYSADLTETSLKETVIIDASRPETLTTLSDLGLMPLEGEGTISLTRTTEALTTQGWTLEEAEDTTK